jgi:hypothetical protein
MLWCFWTQMEDFGRMESRVIQVLDRFQATVIALSCVKLDDCIFVSGVMRAEEKQALRIELLLRKIHGTTSVKVVPETAVMHNETT